MKKKKILIPYNPDRATHPGIILGRVLEAEEISQKSLGERTGLSEKHISQIINGEASISVETALLLENVLPSPASFWINLENNYQETKSRIERLEKVKEDLSLLQKFPYLELVKMGYVEKTNDLCKRVENLWKFFGVNSLSYIQNTEAVAYRKKGGIEIKSEVIATWLKCGEIDFRKKKLPEYSEVNLRHILPQLRALSKESPEKFSVGIKEILDGCGVGIVYTPHFKGSGVSGAFRWIGRNPLIQLSIYYRWSDIFWFNLFHEIGHLLLHGKKEKFIEFDNKELSNLQDKEKEADNFSSELLIPFKAYNEFINQQKFSPQDIVNFADALGIAPGIVAGRLCHDNLIHWKNVSSLRYRLEFTETDRV